MKADASKEKPDESQDRCLHERRSPVPLQLFFGHSKLDTRKKVSEAVRRRIPLGGKVVQGMASVDDMNLHDDFSSEDKQ